MGKPLKNGGKCNLIPSANEPLQGSKGIIFVGLPNLLMEVDKDCDILSEKCIHKYI